MTKQTLEEALGRTDYDWEPKYCVSCKANTKHKKGICLNCGTERKE